MCWFVSLWLTPITTKVFEKAMAVKLFWPSVNTRLTHATPAALYAHSANRNWECDAAINDYTTSSDEISLKDQVIQFYYLVFQVLLFL